MSRQTQDTKDTGQAIKQVSYVEGTTKTKMMSTMRTIMAMKKPRASVWIGSLCAQRMGAGSAAASPWDTQNHCGNLNKILACSFSTTLPPRKRTSRRRLIGGSARIRQQSRQQRLPRDSNSLSVDQYDDDTSYLTVPCTYRDMNNTSLATLGSMENHVALEEMLKRHIMATDNISYEEACQIFLEIEETNHVYEHWMALPFQVTIVMCLTAGLASIPLVFHLPTVEYFNEHFVTADHPQPKELETSLEVGSWSWNWMEPVLG